MWVLWLKFNPEPVYCIQPAIISIKPFCLPAMTISGRQDSCWLLKGPGVAVCRVVGGVYRIQTELNSGYWKRHYGYTVLGFWQPHLQTSPRKHLVQDGKMQTKKAKLWIYSRLLDHSGVSPACDPIQLSLYKWDLGLWQGVSCIWQLLTCPGYHIKCAVGESEVAVGLGPAGNWGWSLTECAAKCTQGVKRLMSTFIYFWVSSFCWVFLVCFDTWDSSIFC